MNRFLRWCLGDTDKRRAIILDEVSSGPAKTYDLRNKHGGWIYVVCRAMESEGILSHFTGPPVPELNRGHSFYEKKVAFKSAPFEGAIPCVYCGEYRFNPGPIGFLKCSNCGAIERLDAHAKPQ